MSRPHPSDRLEKNMSKMLIIVESSIDRCDFDSMDDALGYMLRENEFSTGIVSIEVNGTVVTSFTVQKEVFWERLSSGRSTTTTRLLLGE